MQRAALFGMSESRRQETKQQRHAASEHDEEIAHGGCPAAGTQAHRLIRKYSGSSVNSQKQKNRMLSSAQKTPREAASCRHSEANTRQAAAAAYSVAARTPVHSWWKWADSVCVAVSVNCSQGSG